jgi:hypothetical protein
LEGAASNVKNPLVQQAAGVFLKLEFWESGLEFCGFAGPKALKPEGTVLRKQLE